MDKYQITQQKLEEAKNSNIQLIAVDYDGTVFDRHDTNFNSLEKVVQLAYDVFKSGKEFVLVSGRNTTLEIDLREVALKFCQEKNDYLTIWRSGGTGMNLNKIMINPDTNGISVDEIYTNSISMDLLKVAVGSYKELNIDPDLKSKIFFKNFLDKKIPKDLVPNSYYKIAKDFNGSVFAELVKVTFVLPSEVKKQKEVIIKLREKLNKYDLSVSWGGLPFADVSKNLRINEKIVDGKLYMMKKIIEKMQLKDDQVATFGDSPNDNNKGLLTYPYSFTNDDNVVKLNDFCPPYILKVKDSPVGEVYNAINFLINKK